MLHLSSTLQIHLQQKKLMENDRMHVNSRWCYCTC